MNKYIYHFSSGTADGNANMHKLLGNKGAHLAQMCRLDLPVPEGFTISSEVCRLFYQNNFKLDQNIKSEIFQAVKKLEKVTNKSFGSKTNPLFLAIRSGSATSMPGMMDTILNLGLNDEIVEAFAKKTKNYIFVYDSYRRFLTQYAHKILHIPYSLFEEVFSNNTNSGKTKFTISSLRKSIIDCKNIIKDYHVQIPQDPYQQLEQAIYSVFSSWNSPRAKAYRKINNIEDTNSNAVNVQKMVFGNLSDMSGTGVVFTRSPLDGSRGIWGEFMFNAQGEDIVSGHFTPFRIGQGDNLLKSKMPLIYKQLIQICDVLDSFYKDMQDIEFTVENNTLYLLQTRSGKRTENAKIKILHDLVEEKQISKNRALLTLNPDSISELLYPHIDYTQKNKFDIFAKGIAASPGCVTGIAIFSPNSSQNKAYLGKNLILIRKETDTEDIKAIYSANALVTLRGGVTSHAAIITRSIGKTCVCSLEKAYIDEHNKFLQNESGKIIREGDFITVDGFLGYVIIGTVVLKDSNISKEFYKILSWAKHASRLELRVNAETSVDMRQAQNYGIHSVGLCRTEHMFFSDKNKILLFQVVILGNSTLKKSAIKSLKELHKEDFISLFASTEGKINIRLLDPPLHEFVPIAQNVKTDLAKFMNISIDELENIIEKLFEKNPMLGKRGVRLGICDPTIYAMQVESIFLAAQEVHKNFNKKPQIELMIPFVCHEGEVLEIISLINKTVDGLKIEFNQKSLQYYDIAFRIGVMIELPRAVFAADRIASHVDFFSFGTNDLTQTSYGISRDDSSKFLSIYQDKKIFEIDPFQKLDFLGVGSLIQIAINKGRAENPDLKFGICGEHVADPESIIFFHNIGVDYISCSPYRLPIAILAAACANLL